MRITDMSRHYDEVRLGMCCKLKLLPLFGYKLKEIIEFSCGNIIA